LQLLTVVPGHGTRVNPLLFDNIHSQRFCIESRVLCFATPAAIPEGALDMAEMPPLEKYYNIK
jgi:hypothetical protein